jgi:hypothetical protein
MMNVVADLEEGLTMEVALPEPFNGLRIGLRRTLDDGWLSPAIEDVPENHASELQNCWMRVAVEDPPSTPRKQNGPPSNSPHLPWARGGRRRRKA